eukprot:TRINITY_DN12117_c0_g1_i1.p1 TRINITY_DN12117_c0_g1~~TRINITY_DN12117_c0_g1_i1.p1  ORF type:complete len:357 (+),score=110.78 TRINITY_DN12117_c0_g1_i1:142-1071(+)
MVAYNGQQALEVALQKAGEGGTGDRHTAVDHLLHHARISSRDAVDRWRVAVHRSPASGWPPLLLVLADAVLSATDDEADFVGGVAQLLPKLLPSLLSSPQLDGNREQARALHRALRLMLERWEGSNLPREWVQKLRRLHDGQLADSGVGWVSHRLTALDGLWHAAEATKRAADDAWDVVQELHARAAATRDGRPETVARFRSAAERCRQLLEKQGEAADAARAGAEESVAESGDAVAERIGEVRRLLEEAQGKRRGSEPTSSSAKRRRTADGSGGSSSGSSDDDGDDDIPITSFHIDPNAGQRRGRWRR